MKWVKERKKKTSQNTRQERVFELGRLQLEKLVRMGIGVQFTRSR